MPYLFTCPHCQTKTQVDDRFSGQSGNCVTCGGAIQLPEFAKQDQPGAARPLGGVKSDRLIRWVVAAMVGLVLVGALMVALFRIAGDTIAEMSSGRYQASSMKNLQRIAEALNAYAADFGTYPPSATRDANGRPMHSWRVLILPYLGEDQLYNQFNLSQPWDHPTNLLAASRMPAEYRHPSGAVTSTPNASAYYLITGPRTLNPASGPLGPDRVTDNASQTVLVIEGMPLVPSGQWSEPIDLDISKMQGDLKLNPGIEPGGLLDNGVAFATVDGRPHFVPDTIEPFSMIALMTANGGEPLADDLLD